MTAKKTTKKPDEILATYILDESGSMSSNSKVVMDGFNEYMEHLKGMGNVKFTFTKFNSSHVEVVYNGVDPKDVPALTYQNYMPQDLTPLYDAIGKTLIDIDPKNRHVLVIIQTDGLENASKNFKRDDIFKMIQDKRQGGWEFVFLGADQDAYESGMQLGIAHGNIANYVGASGTSDPLKQVTTSYRGAVGRGTSTNNLIGK